MGVPRDAIVRIQSEWNGWHAAEVKLDDLEAIHWLQPTGAPHPLLHAYVSCACLASGDIPHDRGRTPCPHRIRVCVLKRHVVPSVYAELAQRADAGSAGPYLSPAAMSARRQLSPTI